MKVINGFPPNMADIATRFNGAYRKGVVFAYAPNIYAPHGVHVTPALKAHEAEHIKRQQAVGPDAWWKRYIADPQFRFDEELMGHRAEYQWFRTYRPNKCRDVLEVLADRLSSDLYGSMVSKDEARRMIQERTDPWEHQWPPSQIKKMSGQNSSPIAFNRIQSTA